MGDRVEGILKWLRDLSNWWSRDPDGRLEQYVKLLRENEDKIYWAIKEAMIDELKEYAETIAALIRGEAPTVEKPADGGKGKDNESDTSEVHGRGEKEPETGWTKVLSVVEERGRSDNISLDVQGEVSEDNDRRGVLHATGDRESSEEQDESGVEEK